MIEKIIPRNKKDLLNLILEYGIAESNEIEGVSFEEMLKLENKYGSFPKSYKDILLTIGHRAGSLINRSEYQFYYDDIVKLNNHINEINDEAINEGESIANFPKNKFFFEARYFGDARFFNAVGGNDSKVYIYHEDEESIKFIYNSIWEVVADHLLEAKFLKDLNRVKSDLERNELIQSYKNAGFIVGGNY